MVSAAGRGGLRAAIAYSRTFAASARAVCGEDDETRDEAGGRDRQRSRLERPVQVRAQFARTNRRAVTGASGRRLGRACGGACHTTSRAARERRDGPRSRNHSRRRNILLNPSLSSRVRFTYKLKAASRPRDFRERGGSRDVVTDGGCFRDSNPLPFARVVFQTTALPSATLRTSAPNVTRPRAPRSTGGPIEKGERNS